MPIKDYNISGMLSLQKLNAIVTKLINAYNISSVAVVVYYTLTSFACTG
jgi:hypothetical protein